MVTKVENDRHCQAFLQHEFPSTCLFADALGLITNTVPERKLMDPNKIVFRKNAHCVTHGRTCEFEMKGKLCVMGPPCVLFSRLIGSILIMFKVYMFFHCFKYIIPPRLLVKLRLGKQEQFQNIQKGQVHVVATAAQEKSSGSVHENVKGYDSSLMEKALTHEIDKVEFPSCKN